jgi:hypothetical protein
VLDELAPDGPEQRIVPLRAAGGPLDGPLGGEKLGGRPDLDRHASERRTSVEPWHGWE